jgi:hypothetical protein
LYSAEAIAWVEIVEGLILNVNARRYNQDALKKKPQSAGLQNEGFYS